MHRHTNAWGDILDMAFISDSGQTICQMQNRELDDSQEQVLGEGEEIVGFYAGTTQGYFNNIASLGFIVKEPILNAPPAMAPD